VDLDGDRSAEPIRHAMKQESLPTRSRSHELIEFVHGLKLESLPPDIVTRAKGALLDSLGCTLFGSLQPWSKIMAAEMLAEGSRGAATIVGQKQTVAAPAAALCNGTATHGFELDDLLDEAIVHPGAIIVPAALAAAESVDAPGSRLLLGIVAGYELLNRVGLAAGVEPAHRGFHKTTIIGPVGAAVAAGVILGLKPGQLMSATGLACSTSSGIKSFAAGTGGGMMKRMHCGRAAESGVRMAQLAARDFTGPPTAIDGKFGLLEVYGGQTARPELLTAGLGKDWAMTSIFVKVYSCCSWIQGAVQQLVALRGPKPLKPDEVRQVRIGVSAYAAKNNGEPAPVDTMGAQYSFPYCAALALAGDPTDPGMYLEKEIGNSERRALARRVELYTDDQMEAAYPKHYGSRVELALASGERRASFVLDPHGFPADPVTEIERMEKFTRLAGYAKPAGRVKDIAAAVQRAESLASVSQLTALIRN
jgi:2-methylcitrate dehydratase PrpD